MGLYKFKKRIIQEFVRPDTFFLITFSINLIHSILGFFKRNKKNNGSPILIWDSRRESITYDFTNFILNAVNEFHKKEISYFDLVIYQPKNHIVPTFEFENYSLYVNSDQNSKRIKELIYELAESYSCIREIKLIQDIKEIKEIIKRSKLVYPYNYHPKYYQPETTYYKKLHTSLKNDDNYIIPKIVPNLNHSKKFDQFLSLLKNNDFITLTLRDYGFSPLRNTTNKDVIEATKLAKKLKFNLAIVPDNKKNLCNYPISKDSLICFSARKNIKDRINLYANSKLNIFQTGGPSYIPLFIRGAKTIMLDVGKAGFDNDEKHWKNDHNLYPGDQPYKRLECYMMWYRFYQNYSFEDLLKIYKILNSQTYY